MTERNTILVSGATGLQGGAIARELLIRGYPIRVLTRNPESPGAGELAKLGAELIRGDLDDPVSLEKSVEGAWGVFAVQNTWEAGVEKEEVQGKRIAEIAKKQNVKHFVYSSVGSAHRNTGIPHFDNKWRIEAAIRSLGLISYTIIRPVFFMENFTSPWFKPGIDDGKLMIGIKPDTVLQMISVANIGKYGCWAFENHQQLNGRAIDIADDAQTMPEAAKIIGQAAGKSVEFVSVPIEEVRNSSEDFAIMLEWFDRVGYEVDISKISNESDIRPVTLQEWSKKVDW